MGLKKQYVVIDAGIANGRKFINNKKQRIMILYVLVTDKIKSQSPIRNVDKKMIFTKNNNTIYLHKMENDKSDNFCLEVTSNGKKIKEESY